MISCRLNNLHAVAYKSGGFARFLEDKDLTRVLDVLKCVVEGKT